MLANIRRTIFSIMWYTMMMPSIVISVSVIKLVIYIEKMLNVIDPKWTPSKPILKNCVALRQNEMSPQIIKNNVNN